MTARTRHTRTVPRFAWMLGLLLALNGTAHSADDSTAPWQLSLHLNPGVLEMWQLEFAGAAKSQPSQRFDGYQAYLLNTQQGKVTEASFDWSVRLRRPGYEVDITQLNVAVSSELNAITLRDQRGRSLFVADMPHRHQQATGLDWRYMNLRPSEWLAKRLGQSLLAEQVIGSVDLRGPHPIESKGNADCRSTTLWPSMAAPADIQLFQIGGVQAMRCQGCSTVSTTGQVVVAPDATLLNVGQSDVPWYSKFTAPQPPYNNDQHPMLVWAMYRIDADGGLHPLGSSGVKHAFFAQNDMCACAGDNILYRGCSDLYSRSTNDVNSLLGPRDEIAPQPTLWGRCGSVFDPDCNSVENSSGFAQSLFDRRLLVTESQMQNHPGASYWIEAWYVVREDSNLDNSLAIRQIIPTKVGSAWNIAVSGSLSNGPLVSQWVNPADADPLTDNQLVDTADGRLRLAVRVQDLGNGNWRYRYALMNLDYADAVFSGSEPGLLRLLSQIGAVRLTWPLLRDDANAPTWRDETGDASPSWRLATDTLLQVEATTALGLGWGRLLVVEFDSRFAPQSGNIDLGLGDGDSVAVSSLLPVVVDRIMRNGFE
ncbi:hypothetical protein [Pseudomarimonas arenosa]|uniref:Uncharacterized protein n=1 Tax=Pseudomarimonas arenosa TaxID=2774145 RepID=A0AAW3ZH67_9GAMM|nr:hypothetical protein [Pseudomarimonas arenosa]MBD8525438.1 hypothetical protein [Pseudomarimonas arenosa]